MKEIEQQASEAWDPSPSNHGYGVKKVVAAWDYLRVVVPPNLPQVHGGGGSSYVEGFNVANEVAEGLNLIWKDRRGNDNSPRNFGHHVSRGMHNHAHGYHAAVGSSPRGRGRGQRAQGRGWRGERRGRDETRSMEDRREDKRQRR